LTVTVRVIRLYGTRSAEEEEKEEEVEEYFKRNFKLMGDMPILTPKSPNESENKRAAEPSRASERGFVSSHQGQSLRPSCPKMG
jgi:hypothetical protein